MQMAFPVALVVAAYVLGSIPFSFVVAMLFAGTDIRTLGSHNVGATNVARTSGKLAGLLALLLDVSKGWAAVALARWITSQPGWPFTASITGGPLQSREFWIALAGFIAVVAHMFPVWLRFHGGKGVATATGVFLALDPVVILAAAIVFAIVLLLTRYVSLSSMVSAASVPLILHFAVAGAPYWRVVISVFIALAVILKHHPNIARLAQGSEHRIGEKKDEQ